MDSGLRSAFSVQNALVIYPIYQFGQPEIKSKYLRALIKGDLVGCFGLTEPDHGSDPMGMKTSIRKKGSDYVVNGVKGWISNSPIADVFVVWGKLDDGKVGGVVLEKGMPGLSADPIQGKLSLRASSTGTISMTDVVVPKNQLLRSEGIKSAFMCLNNARFGISWGVLGAAEFCYD